MKEIGMMISLKVLELLYFQIVKNMMENGITEKNKGAEHIIILMEASIQDNEKQMRKQERDHILIQMVMYLMVLGLIMNKLVEPIHFQTAMFMKENLMEKRDMEREL